MALEKTYYNAWRTNEGEKNRNNFYNKKEKYNLHWYSCADEGMENELVLCYAIFEEKFGDNINLQFSDKYIQKKTASGKTCSGKVFKWIRKAQDYEYKVDGTFSNK